MHPTHPPICPARVVGSSVSAVLSFSLQLLGVTAIPGDLKHERGLARARGP